MNAKVDKAGASAADTVKLALAVALLVAGLFGYYYFGQLAGWARVGMLVAGIAGAIVVGAFTAQGRGVREYLVESRFELRKVVWPSREQTLRTTGVIIVVVVLISLMLGLFDVILKWLILDTLLKLGR